MTLPEIINAEQEKARHELGLEIFKGYLPDSGYLLGTEFAAMKKLDSLIASSMLAAVKGAEEVVVPKDWEYTAGMGHVPSWYDCRSAVSAAFRSFIGETK